MGAEHAQHTLLSSPRGLHSLWSRMALVTEPIRRLLSAARMLSSPLRCRLAPPPACCSPACTNRFQSIPAASNYRRTACSSTNSTAAAAAATAAAQPTPAEARAMEAHRAALAAAAAAGPPLEGRTYAPEISWEPEVQAYLEAALGAQALRRISAALARPPLATCLRVNTLRTTPQVRGWSIVLRSGILYAGLSAISRCKLSAVGRSWGQCMQSMPLNVHRSLPAGPAASPAGRSDARRQGAGAAAAAVCAPAGVTCCGGLAG